MEDITQKLNSENVFLQSHAIASLSELILGKASSGNLYEMPEVKLLWQTANKGDFAISTSAVETLVYLVEVGCLPAPATLQNFIADITCAKSPCSLLRGITCLLLLMCQAEPDSEQSLMMPFAKGLAPMHPYVLVLKRCPALAEALTEEVQFLFTNKSQLIQKNSLMLVEPFLLYSLCLTDVTMPTAKPLVGLLLASQDCLGSQLISFLCKAVALIKVESKSHFERKLLVLQALGNIALRSKLPLLSAALLPTLVISLPVSIKFGFPTRTMEGYILSLASHLGQGCDITVCALAETIPLTSGKLQLTLLRVGATLLLHKDGNPLLAGRLLPSLLQVLSGPRSSISDIWSTASTLVSVIQSLPIQVSTNAQLTGNEFWEDLSLSFPNLSTFAPAVDLCNQIIRDPNCSVEWLRKLSSTVHQISSFHHTVVISVFLYQNSPPESVQEALKVMQREVSKCKALALELFPIVLYRLGREIDPHTKLKILYFLPSLVVNKLCIPMVLKTFLALWSFSTLKPVILRLLLEVWKVEPRVYSYLSQLLHEDIQSSSQDLELSRAFVVAEICRKEPSKHGEELLSHLSRFLNESSGKDGTITTIIALNGIYYLCSEAVIDLRTTWKVIAPKLLKDKRPEVIKKLCQLVSLTHAMQVKSAEYEEFTSNIASILWGWASIKVKNGISEGALKALEKFEPEYFTLKMLPPYAREGHRLPQKLASTPFEAARKAEDVLNYVPGLAWVKLASGCSKGVSSYVESFLHSLVAKEVNGLPKGIYVTAVQEAKRRGCKNAEGQPEPLSYSFLPETSILKAAVEFLQDISKRLTVDFNTEESEQMLQGAAILLRSLGQPLHRPFPALDWSFLNELYGVIRKYDAKHGSGLWVSDIKHDIFRVVSQQCNKSSSAMAIILKWLNPSKTNFSPNDEIFLFGLLDQLGRGLNPPTLQQFLNNICTKALEDPNHLRMLLEAMKPHLTCSYINEANRNIMSIAVERLNERIDPNDDVLYSTYKTCVANLPRKHIERLTSPLQWWEVTDEKLLRAAILRCYVATKDEEDIALPWLNDIVETAASLPGDRSQFLLVMIDVLVARSKAEESSSWLLGVLGQLRSHLLKQPGDNLVLVHEQQQRIVFYMDILVLGIIIWSGVWATCSTSKLSSSHLTRNSLLPTALVSLSGRPDWCHALPQLLNWFISCFPYLKKHLANRYCVKSSILLLAAVSPKLSQALWNKIVALFL